MSYVHEFTVRVTTSTRNLPWMYSIMHVRGCEA